MEPLPFTYPEWNRISQYGNTKTDEQGESFKDLEYMRLMHEILKDREVQFRLFWQALTLTAIISTLIGTVFVVEKITMHAVFFLIPHIILVPAGGVIINRARTANRKSGYMIAVYGAHKSNWERDLAKLRSTGGNFETRYPHRSSTLHNMLLSCLLLELVCCIVFVGTAFSSLKGMSLIQWAEVVIGTFYAVIVYPQFIGSRVRRFFCTRYRLSIQGYATEWINALGVSKGSIEGFRKWEWDEKRWGELLKKDAGIRRKKFFWLFMKYRSGAEDNIVRRWVLPTLLSSMIYVVIYFLVNPEHFFVVYCW